jgi:hypothetical protein
MAEARVMIRHGHGTDSDGDIDQPVICVAHLAARFPLGQLAATRKGVCREGATLRMVSFARSANGNHRWLEPNHLR